MSRQFWMETLVWATASGTAVANTTTETILMPNVTIPANYQQDGRSLHIIMYGQYSTTGTPTMLFGCRWGGVTGTLMAKSAAITSGSTVTAGLFEIELYVTTRSNGSSGTMMTNGMATVSSATAPSVGSATGAAAVSAMTAGGIITPAVSTQDQTSDTALALTLTWGAASASNTATGLQLFIESLN
jgi:hypothetical protein